MPASPATATLEYARPRFDDRVDLWPWWLRALITLPAAAAPFLPILSRESVVNLLFSLEGGSGDEYTQFYGHLQLATFLLGPLQLLWLACEALFTRIPAILRGLALGAAGYVLLGSIVAGAGSFALHPATPTWEVALWIAMMEVGIALIVGMVRRGTPRVGWAWVTLRVPYVAGVTLVVLTLRQFPYHAASYVSIVAVVAALAELGFYLVKLNTRLRRDSRSRPARPAAKTPAYPSQPPPWRWLAPVLSLAGAVGPFLLLPAHRPPLAFGWHELRRSPQSTPAVHLIAGLLVYGSLWLAPVLTLLLLSLAQGTKTPRFIHRALFIAGLLFLVGPAIAGGAARSGDLPDPRTWALFLIAAILYVTLLVLRRPRLADLAWATLAAAYVANAGALIWSRLGEPESLRFTSTAFNLCASGAFLTLSHLLFALWWALRSPRTPCPRLAA
jgi:hypothetical protein